MLYFPTLINKIYNVTQTTFNNLVELTITRNNEDADENAKKIKQLNCCIVDRKIQQFMITAQQTPIWTMWQKILLTKHTLIQSK